VSSVPLILTLSTAPLFDALDVGAEGFLSFWSFVCWKRFQSRIIQYDDDDPETIVLSVEFNEGLRSGRRCFRRAIRTLTSVKRVTAKDI